MDPLCSRALRTPKLTLHAKRLKVSLSTKTIQYTCGGMLFLHFFVLGMSLAPFAVLLEIDFALHELTVLA